MRKNISEQLETSLKEIVQEKVNVVDAKLDHYKQYIRFITDSIESMYEQKAELTARGKMIPPPPDSDEYLLTRLFTTEHITVDDMLDDIFFLQKLFIFASIRH